MVRNFFAYYKPNIEIEEDREGETRAIWERIERATENSNDDKVNIIVQKQILLLRYTVRCKRYGTRRTVRLAYCCVITNKMFVLVPERMQTFSCHAFVMHDMSHIGYWHFLEKERTAKLFVPSKRQCDIHHFFAE